MPPKRLLLIVILIFMPLFYLFPGVGLSSRAAWGLHVAGMAGICLLVCLSLENLRQRALAVPAIFLYSTLLEGIQYLHPTRFGSLDDVGYNALGSLVGVVVYLVLAAGGRGWRRWRSKQAVDGLK